MWDTRKLGRLRDASLLLALMLLLNACSTTSKMDRLAGGRFDIEVFRELKPAQIVDLVCKAEQGNKDAAFMVSLYHLGKDDELSLKWLKAAAGLGHATAAANLSGYFLYEVKPPNPTVAAYWLQEWVALSNSTEFGHAKNRAEDIVKLAPELRSGFVRRGILK